MATKKETTSLVRSKSAQASQEKKINRNKVAQEDSTQPQQQNDEEKLPKKKESKKTLDKSSKRDQGTKKKQKPAKKEPKVILDPIAQRKELFLQNFEDEVEKYLNTSNDPQSDLLRLKSEEFRVQSMPIDSPYIDVKKTVAPLEQISQQDPCLNELLKFYGTVNCLHVSFLWNSSGKPKKSHEDFNESQEIHEEEKTELSELVEHADQGDLETEISEATEASDEIVEHRSQSQPELQEIDDHSDGANSDGTPRIPTKKEHPVPAFQLDKARPVSAAPTRGKKSPSKSRRNEHADRKHRSIEKLRSTGWAESPVLPRPKPIEFAFNEKDLSASAPDPVFGHSTVTFSSTGPIVTTASTSPTPTIATASTSETAAGIPAGVTVRPKGALTKHAKRSVSAKNLLSHVNDLSPGKSIAKPSLSNHTILSSITVTTLTNSTTNSTSIPIIASSPLNSRWPARIRHRSSSDAALGVREVVSVASTPAGTPIDNVYPVGYGLLATLEKSEPVANSNVGLGNNNNIIGVGISSAAVSNKRYTPVGLSHHSNTITINSNISGSSGGDNPTIGARGRSKAVGKSMLLFDRHTTVVIFGEQEADKDRAVREELMKPLAPLSEEGRKSLVVPTIPDRNSPQILAEDPRASRYLMKFKEFRLGNTTSEYPMLVNMFLYDTKKRIRLSEDFHCMLNAEKLPPSKCPENAARSAIFRLASISEDIVLATRVSLFEVIENSPKQSAAPTVQLPINLPSDTKKKEKPESVGFLDILKLGKENKKSDTSIIISESITPFRRVCLWGAVRLFGRNSGQTKHIPLVAAKGTIDDDDIQELLDERKKTKPDHAIVVSIESVVYESLPRARVCPSLFPLRPFDKVKDLILDPKQNVSPIIRELQSFERDIVDINLHYINNLYIHPNKITNWKFKSVMVSVKLLDQDTDPTAPGIPNIYGSSLDPKFIEQGRTSIVSDNKPTFFDEIKINLPPILHDKHHLLFEFISVDSKKTKQEIVGYAVQPLTRNSRPSFFTELKELPVVPELSPNYLASMDEFRLSEKDKHHKTVFSFRTYLVSSIIPQDKAIYSFLYQNSTVLRPHATKKLGADEKQKLTNYKRVLDLQQSDLLELYKFFPILSHQLLKLLCFDPEVSFGKAVFTSLIHLIRVVALQSRSKPGQVLKEFFQYRLPVFERDKTSENYTEIFECVTRYYRITLEDKHTCFEKFHLQWVILDIITRSMALFLSSEERMSLPRNKRFSQSFLDDLKNLAKLVFDQTSLQHMVIFLQDLLCMVDRGIVLNIVDKYATSLEKSVQMSFLYMLSAHTHYIPLNFPVQLTLPSDGSVEWKEFAMSLCNRHILIGYLVGCVWEFFSSSNWADAYETRLRAQAIQTFRSILAKHECDSRYLDRNIQIRIAGMYFPFLLLLVDDPSDIQSMQQSEKGDWLTCVIYCLRGLSRATFQKWMALETKKRQLGFFNMLRENTSLFSVSSKSSIVQVAITSLDAIVDYIQVHKQELNEENSEFSVFKHIIYIFRSLLEQPDSQVYEMAIGPLNYFIDTCFKALFPGDTIHEQNDYLEILIVSIMKLCIDISKPTRNSACVLLVKLLLCNWRVQKGISRVRLRMNVAISKVIGSQNSDLGLLQESLVHIKSLTGSYQGEIPEFSDFVDNVNKMIDHMQSLIKQNELLLKNSGDPEMLGALYHKLSEGFSHSPKLRLAWLNNLTEEHLKNGNKTEAGQCKMHMASLMSRYLSKRGFLKRVPSYFDELFLAIAPNALKSVIDNESEKGSMLGDIFSVAQLIETLEEAVKFFEDATFFECCLEVYSLLSILYKAERKPQKMISNLSCHKELLEKMTHPEAPPTRLVPVYFRVKFHGKNWEEDLRNKQFIYKKLTSYNLPVMIKQMEEVFGKKYGQDTVVVLSGNKPAEELSLDDNKQYIQIAGVIPYISPEEANERLTFFEQHFNIERFLFETAFADDGPKNITDDLATQRKKKTVFRTKFPFPYIENRIEVIATEEVILTPIENAIELITTQIAKLQRELDAVPTRVNPLQQTLQGSVVPMVNPGPLKICEIFLQPAAIKEGLFSQADVRRLIDSMEVFIKKCGFGVKLNQYVMEEKHAKFTALLEKSYSSLEHTVKSAIEAANKALVEKYGVAERKVQ